MLFLAEKEETLIHEQPHQEQGRPGHKVAGYTQRAEVEDSMVGQVNGPIQRRVTKKGGMEIM